MIYILTNENKKGGVETWTDHLKSLLTELMYRYEIIRHKITYDAFEDNSIIIINNYSHDLNNTLKTNNNVFFVIHSDICPANQYLIKNIKYIDNVIFVTNQIKDNLESKLLKLKSTLKMFVLDNYFVADNLANGVVNSHDDEITVFNYIGRISPEKNIPMLLYAFAKLNNSDWVLNIYGDGSDERYCVIINVIVKTLEIENNVIFHKFVESKNLMYSSCDFVVLPSISEGSSYSVIESLSYGSPVIAVANVGDNNTKIIDGKNGYLINIDINVENKQIFSNNYVDILKKVGYVEVMLFSDYDGDGKISFNQKRIMLPPNYCKTTRDIFESNVEIIKNKLEFAMKNKLKINSEIFSNENTKKQLLQILNGENNLCQLSLGF